MALDESGPNFAYEPFLCLFGPSCSAPPPTSRVIFFEAPVFFILVAVAIFRFEEIGDWSENRFSLLVGFPMPFLGTRAFFSLVLFFYPE